MDLVRNAVLSGPPSRFWFIGFLTVLVPALAACSGQGTGQAGAPETVVAAESAILTDYAPLRELTGTIKARAETALSFQATGQLIELNADIGDHVALGDVLAKIGSEQQEADVTAATAAFDAAVAQVQQAQTDFERQEDLFNRGIARRSSYEAAQTALETARSSQAAADARLQSAREALTYAVLTASSEGIVTQRDAELGEVAQAGSPVFVIANDGERDAVFDVQEAIFRGQTSDGPIHVALIADRDIGTVGYVREVSPTMDPRTGTVQVKVGLENVPGEMSLGTQVLGTIALPAAPRFVLPSGALWSDGGKPAVWVVDPQSRTVDTVEVTVTDFETDRVVIGSGIEDGQLVVISGTQFLSPGQTVSLEGAPT